MLQNQVDVVGLGVVNRKGSRPFGKKITVRAQAGPNDQVQDLIVLGNIDDVLRAATLEGRGRGGGKKITVRAQIAPDNQVEDLSVRGNIDDVLKDSVSRLMLSNGHMRPGVSSAAARANLTKMAFPLQNKNQFKKLDRWIRKKLSQKTLNDVDCLFLLLI
ncbi:hypothetical protein niasHS_011827 [Heterodera schachtii]|uniref:Uncharacterized protein n=1 Tax=Heterodera schachtii TaxID=97005 RepID=A0ABD2INU5_HETSC